jgi:hypothetical protein
VRHFILWEMYIPSDDKQSVSFISAVGAIFITN